MSPLKIVSGNAQLEWLPQILTLRKNVWPAFIRVSEERIKQFYLKFADYQFSLLEDDKLVAIFNTLPLFFDKPLSDLPDEGVSWVIDTALNSSSKNNSILCAT